eukprot:4169063-Alexandrium_andersonii.AAC.1
MFHLPIFSEQASLHVRQGRLGCGLGQIAALTGMERSAGCMLSTLQCTDSSLQRRGISPGCGVSSRDVLKPIFKLCGVCVRWSSVSKKN